MNLIFVGSGFDLGQIPWDKWIALDNGSDSKLNEIIERLKKMDATLQQVLDNVTESKTLIESTTILLAGLQKQVGDALSGEKLSPAAQAKLNKVWEGLEENKTALMHAITDNTPAAGIPAEHLSDGTGDTATAEEKSRRGR